MEERIENVSDIQIKCKSCGAWFRSPIWFDTFRTFESCTLIGNMAQCPSGHMTPCNKENVKISFDNGGFVGIDT